MAENKIGVESSSWGGSWGRIFPFSSRWTAAGFFPRKVLVSMGSRRGSMGGLVTWEAFKRSLSQYTGYRWGLPMLERSTPPLVAWRYTSWMAWPDQLAFSRKVWPDFTIFRAWVGHRATHRWQATHFLSSASIFFRSPS